MRKPEGGGGGGGSSTSTNNRWRSDLCDKSCRLLQKCTTTKKNKSCLKGRNVSTKFGEDEDDLILKLHALLGNRWSLIAGRLPGRTDNEVKNYWNSHLRKKLPQTKGSIHINRSKNLTSVKPTPTNTSYNNQVSDAVSSFSADYGTTSSKSKLPAAHHNLNLELTLGTMNSSLITTSSCRFTETDQQHVDQSKIWNNFDLDHQFMKNETLVLFR